MISQICQITAGNNIADAWDVKIPANNINDHLRPKSTVLTKELVRKLNNNSLEPVFFERLDSIWLSHSKYLVTSFIDILFIVM